MAATDHDRQTANITKVLADLRDNPLDATETDYLTSSMTSISEYLMGVPVDSAHGAPHWFCHRAAPLTIAAATFLLRLWAYDGDRVEEFKKKFQSCLAECAECIQGLGEAKLSSRYTYFGAFADETIDQFFRGFEAWELEVVLEALSRAGISDRDSVSMNPKTLANAPPAVVYHIVSVLHVLQDSRIQSIIHKRPPTQILPGWPSDPPPPGMLILMIDEEADVRHWAKLQTAKCAVPIADAQFTRPYKIAIESISRHLAPSGRDNELVASAFTMSSRQVADSLSAESVPRFSFTLDSVELWSRFCAVLRLVPPESLTPSVHLNADLRHIVTGHLHDVGPHFASVLKCLFFLIKRLGSDIWKGEGPEFPQVVFDSVKDNPSFLGLLQKIEQAGERPWFLAWFAEYLYTIYDLPVYGEVLAKLADFMCEELQHERFQDARPFIMVAITRLLSSLLRKTEGEDASRQRVAVSSVLDIHAETFVTVAFGRSYDHPKWKNARSSASDLIRDALIRDVDTIADTNSLLCSYLASGSTIVPIPTIRKHMWSKVYDTLQTNDADGVAMAISVVTRLAHLDTLTGKAFKITGVKKGVDPNVAAMAAKAAEAALIEVNCCLGTISNGFLEAVSRYTNYSISSSVLDLIRRPGLVKDITVLMMSPVEKIQAAAQSLVGLAFDVDVRLDCFRAILENIPDDAFEGIFQFLGKFVQFAPIVPEACSLAKSLVRCMTDVIEVLCSSDDGLLRNQHFLRPTDRRGPASQLPKLWNLMTQCIAIIFKRTSIWSLLFESEDMIVWMRDALIFGRDLLAQRRVIENAATTISQQSSTHTGKLSEVGKKMVNDLQYVLPELARWLRLTDEELLHQSFSLLQSLLDCFRESHVLPSKAGMEKLQRHVTDAREKDPKRPQTRLDSTRLSTLEDALASFESADSDDDIQIISHTLGQKKNKEPEVIAKAKPKKIVVEITKKPHPPPPEKQPPTRQSTSKSDISSYFTAEDQQKLNRAVPLPKFQKIQKTSNALAGPSKPYVEISVAKRPERDPKYEGSTRSTPGDESASSDSESEEDEESQAGLASLAKLQRTPQVKKPAERRQIKVLDLPDQRKNAMQQRIERRDDARRTALRLKPDISSLHRAVLSWNYDHAGSEPPSLGGSPSLIRVPDKFTSHAQYYRVFEPLLLLECWAQITQSKAEPTDNYGCTIRSRQFIDDWLDVEISISGDVKKDWYLTDTDVVILRHLESKKCILGKAGSYKSSQHEIQATLRFFTQGTNSDPGLLINSNWQLSKVFSLSTLHREYAALMALPYYDFCDTILQPQLSKIAPRNPNEIQQIMATYGVNEPQANAILSSIQTDGFSLIQGPPGTGKTSTICGLVDLFISKRPRRATAIFAGRNPGPTDQTPLKKVLLCAPSNAAIDEVAYRIKEGSRRFNRQADGPKVVRVGADRAVNISVKDITLDFLVDQKLNSVQVSSNSASSDIAAVRAELEAVKLLKHQKFDEISAVHDNAARTLALEEEIKKLNSRRMYLTQQFDRLKDKQKSDSRTLDATRRKFRLQVLNEADVICSTLSGAGHEILEQLDFEMVIIDEAAQAIELSSLIPLKYSCPRCVMVGDPQQLPPTVLSQEASKFSYNQSLFVRLQKHRPDAVHLLSIQYRMHPDISQLPSRLFYQGRLEDGPNMATKTKQIWHSNARFGTYRFFNVLGQEERASNNSMKNKAECQIAVALYNRLRQEYSAFDFDFKVGVVTMYRAQIIELRRTFQSRFGHDILDKVDFNTVDGFQGQEKDVIILSCVRAGPGVQSVGFLADTRRMNVALTRAKSSLFILGHAATLERSNEVWEAIVLDARTRSFIADVDVEYFTAPATVGTLPRAANSPKVTQPSRTTRVPSSQTIPTNLVTPRELEAAVNRHTPSNLNLKLVDPVPSGSSMQSSSDRPTPEEIMSRKRRLSEHEVSQNSTVTPHLLPEAGNGKPRAPPPKRPKKSPNLFIPKTQASKRLAHDEPGPSHNTR